MQMAQKGLGNSNKDHLDMIKFTERKLKVRNKQNR